MDLISLQPWNLLSTCDPMSAFSYSIKLKHVYRFFSTTVRLSKVYFRHTENTVSGISALFVIVTAEEKQEKAERKRG